ncbi:MAG TPA: universal stress protein [Candidatus Limnocylindrales bacterium]|nr:universal stress protein [Candidatus Limnocylindrales bacterium]
MFEHILLAVDGQEHATYTLPKTVEIAKKFNSDVVVIHVRERDLGRAGAFAMESNEDAAAVVTGTVKALETAGVPARGDLEFAVAGHAARRIVEAAEQHGSDLIVMGSRGLSDFGGLFLGSVTHTVERLAHVPVLVIRAPQESRPAEAAIPAAAQTLT